jgi:hypothetical protein
MSATLSQPANVAREHHDRLLVHIDKMPHLADLIDRGGYDEFRAALDETCTFLTDLLVPHMEAAERALYPQLERMMQNRHSMTPARRDHDAIRAAIDEMAAVRAKADLAPLVLKDQIALRRAIFGLYAMLRVHLAEERLYADIVEHGASEEAEQAFAAAMDHSGPGHLG